MELRRIGWATAVVFWTLFGIVTGFEVWISMITHGHSVPRLFTFYVLVWEAWVVISALAARLTRAFPMIPLKRLHVLVHALAALVFGFVHVAWWIVLCFWMRPYDRMTVPFSKYDLPGMLLSRLPLEFILYCAVAAIAYAGQSYERMRQRELQAAQLEMLVTQAQLRALELQIQPHFLFNTLNAISSLTRNGQNREAVVMISGLSDLLRYTLDHANQQHVPLGEEAAMLERYLEIQRTRFPDRLTYQIDLEEGARWAAVPTLILQPLAENAVRHGIAPSGGSGNIRVRAFRERDDLRVEMFNTGSLRGEIRPGIGLQNTIDRLRQLYGVGHGIDIRNANGGVLASFSIPWTELA